VCLPSEIPGIVPPLPTPRGPRLLDDLDFFEEEELREAIFTREDGQCFYCLRKLAKDAWVIEHVRSRPEGTNGFRNVVAACRACNNRKGSMAARDFVRFLYREGTVNTDELQHRMSALEKLEAGELRPGTAGSFG
jgi:HNH endonuclease